MRTRIRRRKDIAVRLCNDHLISYLIARRTKTGLVSYHAAGVKLGCRISFVMRSDFGRVEQTVGISADGSPALRRAAFLLPCYDTGISNGRGVTRAPGKWGGDINAFYLHLRWPSLPAAHQRHLYLASHQCDVPAPAGTTCHRHLLLIYSYVAATLLMGERADDALSLLLPPALFSMCDIVTCVPLC